MLKKNKLRLSVAAVACLAAVGLSLSAVPAFADPAAGSFKTLSGVGSDTIQDVANGLASQISSIGSYDAVDPANPLATVQNIQTKSGGPSFTRPNGSGAGINALSDSIQGGTHLFNTVNILGQVDFARSSSGPSVTGSDLTYIPFAQDAVTYAVNAGSDFPRNLPVGSSADAATKLSLYNIYHCIKLTYTDSNSDTVAIHPLVPQSGSGTAKFWASTLGFSDTALPSCVKRVNTDSTPVAVQEHDGTSLDDAGDIVPFSIAQYIAQGNHASISGAYGVTLNERRGQASLGSINGQPAVRISGATTIMNPAFPVTRLVFNVVSTTRIQTAGDPLVATFVGAGSSVCTKTALIQSFGFAPIANCGAVTTTGGFTQ